MSFIPPNSRLQLSDTSGNINNKGVVGSNTTAPYLSTFPTTNTGTSQGTYLHLGVDGQNNLRTDFLNASGTSTGGFNFWTSNSTQSPQELAQISTDGILVDTQFKADNGACYIQTTPRQLKLMDTTGITDQEIRITDGTTTNIQTKGNIALSDGFYYNTNIDFTGFQSAQGDPVIGALGVMRADTHNILISDGDEGDIRSLSRIQPPTFLAGKGLEVFNFATGGKITGVAQSNNASLSCSTIDETIYGKLDKTSLVFNDGTINRASLNSATPTLTLNDGTNTSVLSTTQLLFNGVPVSGSPASASVLNFNIDGDPHSIIVVNIDGATQLTTYSNFVISSGGEDQYVLNFPINITNSSQITATYYSQSQKMFHSVDVFYTSSTITLQAQTTRFVVGLNTFYLSGIIFS